MDLFIPKHRTRTPTPAILWIHGGGWERGDKNGNSGALLLANEGFVTASLFYRLSGDSPFPADIEDCKCAIRFLRANASKYGIDPERIGVAGAICGRPSRRASCNSRAERRTRRRWRLAKCLEQRASRRRLLRGLGFHGRRNGVPASHRPSRLEARSGLRKRQAGFISPGEPPIPRVERQPAFIAGTRRTRRSSALRPIRPRGRSLPPARAAGRVHRSKKRGTRLRAGRRCPRFPFGGFHPPGND